MAVFRDKVKLEDSLKEVEKEAKDEEISLLRQMEALKAKKRKTSTQPLCNFHAMAQQFTRQFTHRLLRVSRKYPSVTSTMVGSLMK